MNAYLSYILGVVLITLPAGVLTAKHLKVATITDVTERNRQRLGWLHPINVIDLVRAYAGMSLVIGGFITHESTAKAQLITHAAIAIVSLAGLGMQLAFHRTKEDELAAPLAFSFGLVVAMVPLPVALLSLPLGIATAIAVRNLGVGLFFASVATAILGHLFRADLATTGIASLLLFLPAILSSLLHRSLVLTVRRGPAVRYCTLREVSLPDNNR